MAEQENESLDNSPAEEAGAIVPRIAQRKGLYVVEKEFTHKRKQVVGSIFRPRRYPRLRPLKLQGLIAGGYIRLASADEVRQKRAPQTVRINRSEKSVVAPPIPDGDEAAVSSIRPVGGGWWEVVIDNEVTKVQGKEAAETMLAEAENG